VQLVVSDAHEGLKQAIAQVLGTAWQRCTVHFLRDALGHCPKDTQQLVGAASIKIVGHPGRLRPPHGGVIASFMAKCPVHPLQDQSDLLIAGGAAGPQVGRTLKWANVPVCRRG